jgi:hypothetical protein
MLPGDHLSIGNIGRADGAVAAALPTRAERNS